MPQIDVERPDTLARQVYDGLCRDITSGNNGASCLVGYDLCIGHGFEFQDAAARVAKDFPRTVFVTTSGSRTAPNLAPIVFELEQATYLCGLAAVDGDVEQRRLPVGQRPQRQAAAVGGPRIQLVVLARLRQRSGGAAGDRHHANRGDDIRHGG